jgi:multicomponent Na+:H+ antiporter subunit D
VAAIVAMLAWRSRLAQRVAGVAGAMGLCVSSIVLFRVVLRDGVQAVQLGGWPAPFGITLVADLFGAIMVVLAGLTGLAVTLFSLWTVDRERESFGYYPLLLTLLTGVSGAFLTGDIFNLYVWFEVMLMASFVLLALGGERPQIEGAVKYVTLNLMASALFLTAVGLLYGMTGTLNMADLAVKLPEIDAPGVVTAIAMLFLGAFGVKAAIFPLFFWLPASYHTPPAAVSAIFAALLTKVGVYALVRVFTLVFVHDVAFTHGAILVAAVCTMVTGVLGAMAQNEFRRILSFHIVSQIGYMLMGLGLFTPLALAGTIFYLVHHIIVKTNLFLISGVALRVGGTLELKRIGGFATAMPALAVLFLVPAMSLAGLPPLSGFFAKLSLVKAGLDAGAWVAVVAALAVGALTLFSMTKIWHEVFWKPAPDDGASTVAEAGAARPALLAPVIGLAVLTVLIGVGAGPLFEIAMQAAHQLLDPDAYITAVLGDRR